MPLKFQCNYTLLRNSAISSSYYLLGRGFHDTFTRRLPVFPGLEIVMFMSLSDRAVAFTESLSHSS